MDEKRVAEYFLVAGLPNNPVPLAQFSCDGAILKANHSLPPITDIAVINRTLGEVVPDGFTCIEFTPTQLLANLNHGVIRSQELFLCYRRGRDKPPLVDVGVLLEGRDRLLADSQLVEFSVRNHSANINPNGVATYMTYRRAMEENTCNELVVLDICIIISSKGEVAPHSYCTIDRNLNKGTMIGSDIFVCYKKSVNRTFCLAYQPEILDKYPLKNHSSFPLLDNVALFCLPMGATLEAWHPNASSPRQVFSTFVLTVNSSKINLKTGNDSVEKIYGAAITFYERFPHDQLTEQQRIDLQLNDHFGCHNLIYNNKSICILSKWPFFDTFEKFLNYLHRMMFTRSNLIPMERYIWHMLDCVPFPSAKRPRILVQLDSKYGISLTEPEDSPISLSGANFRKLVMTLKPEGCLLVLLYALTEQKLLLHSLRPDVLISVAEAITQIIFPFRWQCPYIPLCPLGLSDLIDAPTPFLLGLDSRFFDLYEPPSHVICIDLDTAAVSIPLDKGNLTTKIFPKKAFRTLRNTLEALCPSIKSVEEELLDHQNYTSESIMDIMEWDFKMKKRELKLETQIQDAFLRFTATILKGYSNYLLPIINIKSPDNDMPQLFDECAFLKSRERTYQNFFELMVNTQMFSKFIEERSFVSDQNASLVFFDDCIKRIEEEDSHTILLDKECSSSEHSFFLPPPEAPLINPVDGYSYNGMPKLRPSLFPSTVPLGFKSLLSSNHLKKSALPPVSPVAHRSKHEIKSAQRLASKHYLVPKLWAKCLLSTCFSVWFAHLPSFISCHPQKGRVLNLAFHILKCIQSMSLTQPDEICYRVMMQLCGVHRQPILAVKTLCEMRNAGITPNAITYGYYNRAVLESKWNHSNLMWNKLRNVIRGASAFRKRGIERAERRSLSADDAGSRYNLESLQLQNKEKSATLNADPRYSISSGGKSNILMVSSSTDSMLVNSAGLLMSCSCRSSTPDAYTPQRFRNKDLAEALDPTLKKYDQIVEPANLDIRIGKGVDYFRSSSFGKDDKIVKRLLNLVYLSSDNNSMSSHEGSLLDLSVTGKSKKLVNETCLSIEKDKQAITDGNIEIEHVESKLDSPENLSDIEVDNADKSFFSRNTPERLSNMFKKGVGDADLKWKELLRRRAGPILNDISKDPLNVAENTQKINKNEFQIEVKMNMRDTLANKDSCMVKNENCTKYNSDVCSNLRTPTIQVHTLRKISSLKDFSLQEIEKTSNCSNKEVDTTSSCSDKDLSKISETGFLIDKSIKGEKKSLMDGIQSSSASLFVDNPDNKKSSSESFSIVFDSQPVCVENDSVDGRHKVLAGDPLGALGNFSSNDVPCEPLSLCYANPLPEDEPNFSSDHIEVSEKFSYKKRSDTFPPMKKVSSNLLRKSESLFSGESESKNNDSDLVNQAAPEDNLSTSSENSLAVSFMASPFKLPMGSSKTFELASTVASQGIRRASKHIGSLRSQYIDPAVNELTSPSNFVYRKNELISGGLGGMKFAVTSLSKKYNEIREAITPAPTKRRLRDDEDIQSLVNGLGSRSSDNIATAMVSQEERLPPLHGSDQRMPLNFHEISLPPSWSLKGPFCLGIFITSCSKCYNCKGLLFDEEIMTGWSPDDSNLNTRCWHCNAFTVPLLTVSLYYLRHRSQKESIERKQSHASFHNLNSNILEKSNEKIEQDIIDRGIQLDPFNIPYLSPIVLRKELETMLMHEGDNSLTVRSFPDQHPILYWNLLWYLSRLNLPSHLPGLCLSSLLLKDRPSDVSWENANWLNVYVHCLWDNWGYHRELGVPLYIQWKDNYNQSSLLKALTPHRSKFPKDILQSFMTLLHYNKVNRCLEMLLQEFRKRPADLRYRHYPVYREFLFFILCTIPKEDINLESFEREYRREFDKMSITHGKLLLPTDGPPPLAAVFCRNLFRDLKL